MLRAFLYFIAATALNFLLMKLTLHTVPAETLYYSATFGLAVAAAYALDSEKFGIRQKALISFSLMIALVLLGTQLYSIDAAMPAMLIFASVFFGYYLLASFRDSKSLRR